jgi:hypothetical protein
MNTLSTGTRATGKSTLALFLAYQWGGTIIIYDPRGSYKDVGIQCSNVEEVMEHLNSGSEDEMPDYYDKETGKVIPIVYHVDDNPEQSFAELSRALFPPRFEGWSGRLALIVDESRTLQSHNYITKELDRLVGQHPIESILIIQTSHEIKEFNSKNKSVMEDIYIFYQVGEMNYQRVEELCGKEVAETVRSFEPRSKDDPRVHYYVRYSFVEFFEGGKRWYVCTEPSSWYVPLGNYNKLPGDNDTQKGHPESLSSVDTWPNS